MGLAFLLRLARPEQRLVVAALASVDAALQFSGCATTFLRGDVGSCPPPGRLDDELRILLRQLHHLLAAYLASVLSRT